MTFHSGNYLLDPYKLFDKVKLHAGMHIADLGCGRTGHVVFPAAKVVGETGIVYAVDILKDVLASLQARATLQACANIETIWADLGQAGSLPIAPKTLDVGFFINVLFHFRDYAVPLAEAARILKDKGRLVVVDWVKGLPGLGPGTGKKVDFFQIQDWAQRNNFVVQDDFVTGPYHRCVILFRQQ